MPLLRGVLIQNPGDAELSDVAVELFASPSVVRPKRWTIDRVAAGESFSLCNVDGEIDSNYLDRLNEAVRCALTFRLVQRDRTLAETTHAFRILSRDEWGGLGSMGQLLPAFVTPNDPALPLRLSRLRIASGNLLRCVRRSAHVRHALAPLRRRIAAIGEIDGLLAARLLRR